MIKIIFSYTGSPLVKISEKFREEGYFFDSHCIVSSSKKQMKAIFMAYLFFAGDG